jgi:glutamine amidotransferase PdxT
VVGRSTVDAGPLIGVLALQGGFEAHERMLWSLGARTRQVRVQRDLEGLDGLVVPGGESTTMTLGVEREGLAQPLRDFAASGAEHGPDVEILAEVEGHPIAARQGNKLAVAFHAELGEDDRLHRLFLRGVRDIQRSGTGTLGGGEAIG